MRLRFSLPIIRAFSHDAYLYRQPSHARQWCVQRDGDGVLVSLGKFRLIVGPVPAHVALDVLD